MADNWEDWENEDIVIPILNQNILKQLEERKLVEEADNKLTNDLFNDHNILNNEINKIDNKSNFVKNIKKIKIISKQKENELKQKEFSKKLKEKKQYDKNINEIFGECLYDEYDIYDKFDKY